MPSIHQVQEMMTDDGRLVDEKLNASVGALGKELVGA
jgi:hypothetical protein